LPVAERGFSCILSFTPASNKGVAVSHSAEGIVLRDSGTIDGGEQGAHVSRLDHPSTLQVQTAQGQEIVLFDRVEEAIGRVRAE
jgi:hypothetical protein